MKVNIRQKKALEEKLWKYLTDVAEPRIGCKERRYQKELTTLSSVMQTCYIPVVYDA
jgi:hypothetical protein